MQEFNMGVEASIAIPNMGSAFSDASLKNSLLLCKCFIIEQIVFFLEILILVFGRIEI